MSLQEPPLQHTLTRRELGGGSPSPQLQKMPGRLTGLTTPAAGRTMFDGMNRVLRGVVWFVFEPTTLRIQEVRPFEHGSAFIVSAELRPFFYLKSECAG